MSAATRPVWKRLAESMLALTIVVATALILLWARIPVNKYAWMGGDQLPYDCDGPAAALLVLVPAAVLMMATLWAAIVLLRRRGSTLRYVMALVALLGCIRLGFKAVEVAREHHHNRGVCD